MDQLNDWLGVFGYETPRRILERFGATDKPEFDTFGSVEVEQDLQLVTRGRRPELYRKIKREPQLFGPNLIVGFVSESHQVKAEYLRGAGSVEQTLAAILNGTVLIELFPTDLNMIDLYVPEGRNQETMEALEQLSSVLTTITSQFQSGSSLFKVVTTKFELNFWLGFRNPQSVLDFKAFIS